MRLPDDEISEIGDDTGDPACWLSLCCPECGAMREATGTAHLEWCASREPFAGDARDSFRPRSD
ncbi:MAG: hypothetical protein WCF24_03975 [Acidimicrobiales bacterium]